MNVVVFDTEAEAITAEATFYADHIAVHNNAPYVSGTTHWATPRQRIDGKWTIPVSDDSDTSGMTIEVNNNSDYAE